MLPGGELDREPLRHGRWNLALEHHGQHVFADRAPEVHRIDVLRVVDGAVVDLPERLRG
jgi:hypothetical protein